MEHVVVYYTTQVRSCVDGTEQLLLLKNCAVHTNMYITFRTFHRSLHTSKKFRPIWAIANITEFSHNLCT